MLNNWWNETSDSDQRGAARAGLLRQLHGSRQDLETSSHTWILLYFVSQMIPVPESCWEKVPHGYLTNCAKGIIWICIASMRLYRTSLSSTFVNWPSLFHVTSFPYFESYIFWWRGNDSTQNSWLKLDMELNNTNCSSSSLIKKYLLFFHNPWVVEPAARTIYFYI